MDELHWWLEKGHHSGKKLILEPPYAFCKSDASGYAWGAIINGAATHGMWSGGERKDHINVLELKAALFGIQSLCRDLHHCHIRIEIDNTTAVSYINQYGWDTFFRFQCSYSGTASMVQSSFYLALGMPHRGKDNSAADSYSRKTSIHTEWSLNKALFAQLCATFGT